MRAVLTIALVILTSLWTDAHACTCEDPDLATAASEADAVFAGTVTKITEHDDDFDYEVRVDSVWKGTAAATVVLHAGSGRGDCSAGSLGKITNQRWLFFTASRRRFDVTLCSGTQRATDAAVAALTKRLGTPAKP